jgi:hypothetical protein
MFDWIFKGAKSLLVFIRETVAATVGDEVAKAAIKQKMAAGDSRASIEMAIINIQDPHTREIIRRIQRRFTRQWREDKFVEDLMKIPTEDLERVFENLAHLWENGRRREVDQFFYGLEHNWIEQSLRRLDMLLAPAANALHDLNQYIARRWF